MKRFWIFLGCASVLFLATQSALAKSKPIPGKYVVRLKSANTGHLPLESVGRLLGGIVKSRSSEDPQVVLIEKDKTLASKFVIAELLRNPVVESAKPYVVSASNAVPESARPTSLGL